MSSSILVANLHEQHGLPSSIRFQDIQLGIGGHADRCPTIFGFHSVSDSPLSSSPINKCSLEKHMPLQAFSRGKKVAVRVAQLLNGKPQITFLPREMATHPAMEMPFMCPGDVALVGGLACEGHTGDSEGITSYQKIDFHFSNAAIYPSHDGLTSTQYMHLSCPNLGAEDALFTEHGTTAFDHVEIVSGICLFSDKIIRSSISDDGRIDVQKLLRAKPTLYEMEYIARSSSAIADVASTIISRSRVLEKRRQHGFSLSVGVTLDVPSWHYYQSVAEKLEQGLCTADEALEWFDAVELRSGQVARVFENAVRHELGKRGITPPYDCEIQVSPKTNLIASSIRQALQDGRSPSLDDILWKLSDQEDGVWQDFYKPLPPKERPESFRALGYLFYVFQVVRPALMKRTVRPGRGLSPGSTSGSASEGSSRPSSCSEEYFRPRRLVIGIDERAERRVYSRAQTFLKKIRHSQDSLTNPTLVEMYMCRRVFLNSNETGSHLYFDNLNPESPVVSLSDALEASADGSSSPLPKLEPVDVVRNLYGIECARNLQTWFTEVGLGKGSVCEKHGRQPVHGS